MKLVIVENRLDRAAGLINKLPCEISKILIYQTPLTFSESTKPYRKEAFLEKVQRVDAWNLYSTLDELFDVQDEYGQPKYVFLFNLNLEDVHVPLLQKLSFVYIKSKERVGEDFRCFAFSAFGNVPLHFDPRFRPHLIETDFNSDSFLQYKNNYLFCKMLSIPVEGALPQEPEKITVDKGESMEKRNIFKVLRLCLGLTQCEMAERCDLSLIYLSELELGRKTYPSERTLQKFADACGLQVSTLKFFIDVHTDIDYSSILIRALEQYAESRRKPNTNPFFFKSDVKGERKS